MKIILDEGYSFSLGCFETILVVNNKSLFLDRHLARMKRTLDFLGIEKDLNVIKYKIFSYLSANNLDNHALKVTVSRENILVTSRPNPYHEQMYQKGFVVGMSNIYRNETSPFVYHKTLMYGENIMEKRRFNQQNIDEPIFVNSKGLFAEGATSNVFFVKHGKIITPKVDCGLLDGVMRRHIIETYDVLQTEIYKGSLYDCDEMFVTNSLLGIMPVRRFDNFTFNSMDVSYHLHQAYEERKINF